MHLQKLNELQEQIDKKERELVKSTNNEDDQNLYIQTLQIERDELREFKGNLVTQNGEFEKAINKVRKGINKAQMSRDILVIQKYLEEANSHLDNITLEMIHENSNTLKK